MKNILYTIVLFTIAHTMVWFQTNGQFISEWIKRYPLVISLLGIPISYLYIKGTFFCYQHFNQLWPGRILAFCIGIIIFTIMTYLLMNETVDFKTGISLSLALVIILIQLFL
jgi:hypothetical protein